MHIKSSHQPHSLVSRAYRKVYQAYPNNRMFLVCLGVSVLCHVVKQIIDGYESSFKLCDMLIVDGVYSYRSKLREEGYLKPNLVDMQLVLITMSYFSTYYFSITVLGGGIKPIIRIQMNPGSVRSERCTGH